MPGRGELLAGAGLTAAAVAVLAGAITYLYIDSREEHRRAHRFPDKLAREYKLGRRLGKGSTGHVYAAVDRASGRRVAIKVIRKASHTVRNSHAMEVELAVLSRVSHPFIITLIDVHTTDSRVFLVLELAGGGELFSYVENHGPLPEPLARRVFANILSATAALHRQGIIHRDIKLENVLLADADDVTSVRLIDFGFAKVNLGHMETDEVATGRIRERARTWCGTTGYAAPEVLSGEEYGEGCDVWSLGVVLHILLVGYPPFEETPMEEEWVPNLSLPRWADVSADAHNLVRAMLCPDPARRATTDEVAASPWLQADQEAAAPLGGHTPM